MIMKMMSMMIMMKMLTDNDEDAYEGKEDKGDHDAIKTTSTMIAATITTVIRQGAVEIGFD